MVGAHRPCAHTESERVCERVSESASESVRASE